MSNQHPERENCRRCGAADWAYRKADGVQYGKRYCKECNRAKAREKSTPRKRLVRYGITEEQYNTRLLAQKALCAICGKGSSEGRALCIDHDHETGLLRGLLCDNCNKGIGLLQDSVDVLERALDYLKQYKGVEGL